MVEKNRKEKGWEKAMVEKNRKEKMLESKI